MYKRQYLTALSERVLGIAQVLRKRRLQVKLTAGQWRELNLLFSRLLRDSDLFDNEYFPGVVKRYGLITYRLCMIFTALDAAVLDYGVDERYCCDSHFRAASVSYTHLDVYKRQDEVNSMIDADGTSLDFAANNNAKYPGYNRDNVTRDFAKFTLLSPKTGQPITVYNNPFDVAWIAKTSDFGVLDRRNFNPKVQTIASTTVAADFNNNANAYAGYNLLFQNNDDKSKYLKVWDELYETEEGGNYNALKVAGAPYTCLLYTSFSFRSLLRDRQPLSSLIPRRRFISSHSASKERMTCCFFSSFYSL